MGGAIEVGFSLKLIINQYLLYILSSRSYKVKYYRIRGTYLGVLLRGAISSRHHKNRLMSQMESTLQKKLKYQKILSHAYSFTSYAHFCNLHVNHDS